MKLLIFGTPSEQGIVKAEAKTVSVKFIILRKNDGAIVTFLFGTHTQHSHFADAMIEEDSSLMLVGGGFVRKGVAEWGSESCRDFYGYDRPEEPEEAKNVLGELQEEVLRFL